MFGFETISTEVILWIVLAVTAVVIAVLARLQTIPEALYEAARIDGAGPISRFTPTVNRNRPMPAISMGRRLRMSCPNCVRLAPASSCTSA